MPQPDVMLFMPVGVGGQAQVNDDGYLEGPPDLVAEVTASTASIDLNLKFQVYRRSGIREYLVWRTLDKAVDWFVLEDGQYVQLPADVDGNLKSRACPGLWLDPLALVKLQSKRLHAVLEQGLGSPEYGGFAERVAAFAPPDEA